MTTRVLNERHRDELHASGISDETIASAGIYSTADAEIHNLLGWQPKNHHWGDGYALPFPAPNGERNEYCRVKLDYPRHAKDGKSIKYESPRATENHVYFPPGVTTATLQAAFICSMSSRKRSCFPGLLEP